MAKQRKVSGKVKKDRDKDWIFTIEADPGEVDMEIDLLVNGNYEVDKLETGTLPKSIVDQDGKTISIRWLNNFSIKQNGNYVKKKYKVTIRGLISKLKEKNSQLVIYSDTHEPKLYFYGPVDSDTIELTDGDPAGGMAP